MVYFSSSSSSSNSCSSDDQINSYLKDGIDAPNGTSNLRGLRGRLHFLKFETTKISECIKFISSKQLQHDGTLFFFFFAVINISARVICAVYHLLYVLSIQRCLSASSFSAYHTSGKCYANIEYFYELNRDSLLSTLECSLLLLS